MFKFCVTMGRSYFSSVRGKVNLDQARSRHVYKVVLVKCICTVYALHLGLLKAAPIISWIGSYCWWSI